MRSMSEAFQHSNERGPLGVHWDGLACPCFEPTVRLPWSEWPGKFRPPLGAPFEGICHADRAELYRPAGQLLLTGCNMGYARDQCDRVPADAPDAVRFVYARADTVRWVLETNHRPGAQGVSENGLSAGQGTVMDSQLSAYRSAIVQSRRR